MLQKPHSASRHVPFDRFPSLPQQAWDLSRSLAAFAAEGFAPFPVSEYLHRLSICGTCKRRRGSRCTVCGGRLAQKARARMLQCPLGKWPLVGGIGPGQ